MANIDLGNLTRYDGKIKQYAEDKYLSKNTANWQMTEKAGAVTCYPVPDTELEPVVEFSFTETPPAEGEKGPDNPSTITGVSSVNINRCGKNLFDSSLFPTSFNLGGVDVTVGNDGVFTLNGVCSASNPIWRQYIVRNNILKNCYLPEGTMVSLSFDYISGTATNSLNEIAILAQIETKNKLGSFGYNSVSSTKLTTTTGISDRCITGEMIIVYNGAVFTDFKFKVQLEIGNTVTAFETYSGNEYTLALGNAYYGGSVNLATGLMTVTQNFITFTGTETGWRKTGYSNDSISSFAIDLLPRSMEYPNLLVCSHFPKTAGFLKTPNTIWIWDNGICFICLPGSDVTTANFKEWLNNQYLANTPVTLTYPLTNPYVVQLDPIQIKSLTALDKNTPRLNTLYTDANSIQVGYQKHPARTSYELENAILALGGGE